MIFKLNYTFKKDVLTSEIIVSKLCLLYKERGVDSTFLYGQYISLQIYKITPSIPLFL